MTTPLIEAVSVSRRFSRKLDYAEKIARALGANLQDRTVHAVDDVDLSVMPGEVVGLVGESGCGKSTLGRMMAGIMPVSDGEVRWKGNALPLLEGAEKRAARLAAQMIFQDPMSTLNPRKRVIDLIGEAPRVHGLVARREIRDYVADITSRVGLDPSYLDRYPHQFSGGQRQRIGIARALAVRPELLVCDESVAALDVSIQAQILNLFMDLKQEFGLTYLFISHDLGVVKHICDRVVVMYLGRIVESAAPDELFAEPRHPYTQALIRELPEIGDRKRAFTPIRGEIPSPLHPPAGCHFHPRCPMAFDRCRVERPRLQATGPGHVSACHLNDPIPAPTTTLPVQPVTIAKKGTDL
ncbi:ATP-binding cassette domain-containing protein [Agrobacterium sp. a22-2]|uniref:ABC transporter ATP-binding protein n=1 Tax=Agrobacterium sp. a22-2 TaxID=2283840 RepID=UPI0014481C72|nr:oligopeptide/dipeptide ABC transporter ATP-binding protein [Agrobacterium sp. a22-2]NKN35818.1 ATP-binding cassette domain-containing protein [Agrobacterium sp. a22-2]